MRKIRINYLFLGILLFMVLGKTTSVNANEATTNVNGESQGQMRVTGTLGSPKTSESKEEVEEEFPNEEKTEPTKSTGDSTTKVASNGYLPKTNEIVINPMIEIVGLVIIFVTGQIIIKINKREEI